MLTKTKVLRVAGKSDTYFQLINVFLFNLVIKGIVEFDDLPVREQKSCIRMLEGKNKRFIYDFKTKQIISRCRRTEGVE